MNTSSPVGRRLIYFLIFISGVSGLIYQVVWHKYLSILLGAQARATAIVLAIFLGGISLGYATFGRWCRDKKWNLLLVYSIVEMAMAFWAFLFPYFFLAAMPLTAYFYRFLGVNSILIDIFMSILLIGFPTFLMGGTLPLLTQGLSEDLEEASGTHARIYGFNTIGACVGSLLAGYVLIPVTSLPITTTIGGIGNLLVSLATYFCFAKFSKTNEPLLQTSAIERVKLTSREISLFVIGFCSGFYVLSLENVLIRLVGLSTGSSNYNFTLIVSIFVFGLGFGSLLVRKIARYTESHLIWNQLGVSFFLLLLYLSGDCWSYWVHLIRIIFRDTPSNFYLYQATLGMAFLAILAIPIGMCGLTLPLCFHLVKDKKETLGYRVGQLYGINTIGCVMGALFGGYFLLNYLNLDQLFKFCVGVSLVSSAFAGYLYYEKVQPKPLPFAGGAVIFSLVLVGVLFSPMYHKERFIQPFRQQQPLAISYNGVEAWGEWLGGSSSYLFYKDGPNTSVGIGSTRVGEREVSRTIFVNGKSDGNTRGDFLTMALTGHIPGLLARRLDRVCIIGHGTGMSIGAIASYEDTKRIDVADIADTILDNRHYFDPYNGNMSKSPKVFTHSMDAFRFLEGTKDKYDVIVSEPSNPWVAGVENLYSSEFYDIAKGKLNSDGVYVQWVQAYSFTEPLLKMVLRTVTNHFRYVSVFQMLEQDMAIVATDTPFTRADLIRSVERLARNRGSKALLEQVGITRLETLLALELVPSGLSSAMAESAEELHLEKPRLSHAAARAFFSNATVRTQTLRRQWKEFYPAVDNALLSIFLQNRPPDAETISAIRKSFCEHKVTKNKYLCEEAIVMGKWLSPSVPYENIYQELMPESEVRAVASFHTMKEKKFTDMDLIALTHQFDYFKKYYSPIAKLPIDTVLFKLDFCLENTPKANELYGDCLLQKAAVTEIVQSDQSTLINLIAQYEEWFSRLPSSSISYTRFRRASELLNRVLSEYASGKRS